MKLRHLPLLRASVLLLAAWCWGTGTVRAADTVVAWGANTSGESNVPAGLTNAIAVAGGAAHSLALKADGTLIAWGEDLPQHVAQQQHEREDRHGHDQRDQDFADKISVQRPHGLGDATPAGIVGRRYVIVPRSSKSREQGAAVRRKDSAA